MAAVLCIVGEAMNERIKEFAEQAGFAVYGWNENEFEKFAALVAAHEREAIAQMFEDAPALSQFAQNYHGNCWVCGFTPKLVIEAIRKRGTI